MSKLTRLFALFAVAFAQPAHADRGTVKEDTTPTQFKAKPFKLKISLDDELSGDDRAINEQAKIVIKRLILAWPWLKRAPRQRMRVLLSASYTSNSKDRFGEANAPVCFEATHPDTAEPIFVVNWDRFAEDRSSTPSSYILLKIAGRIYANHALNQKERSNPKLLSAMEDLGALNFVREIQNEAIFKMEKQALRMTLLNAMADQVQHYSQKGTTDAMRSIVCRERLSPPWN